jgi:hypothetical protein
LKVKVGLGVTYLLEYRQKVNLMDELEGVKLSLGGVKKLGNLINLKDDIIADAI